MSKKGFGTNFHKVYNEDPELYHDFSKAEIFSKGLKEKIKTSLKGDILLDVACGTCHKTNIYSEHFEKVFALDYSKPLLEYAKNKYSSNKKINYIWSSAANIPLLDESVDSIIVTWGSFPLSKTIIEMKRVLKKGGTIVRIGAYKKDEFTSLFPSFSSRRINYINSTFKRQGFIVTEELVNIEFESTSEAKRILSKITGSSSKKINKNKFEHTISLCYYKK